MGANKSYVTVDVGESSTVKARGGACLYSNADSEKDSGPPHFGCSTSAPRGEPASREGGYPLKRTPALVSRQSLTSDQGAAPLFTDGYHIVNGHQNILQMIMDYRSDNSRMNKGDHSECLPAKGKFLIYRLLIIVVAACFLAEAFMQGSILMLLKQTELLSGPLEQSSAYDGLTSTNYSLNTSFKNVHEIKDRSCNLYNLVEDLQGYQGLTELRRRQQVGIHPPRLALVSSLDRNADNLLLITLANGFLELGYHIEVYAVKNGSLWASWRTLRIPMHILYREHAEPLQIDWSIYEGVIANSIYFYFAYSSLMQEPFKCIPVVWIIQDDVLARYLKEDSDPDGKPLLSEWKNAFARANFVTFSNHVLLEKYVHFDAGNFLLIPGSPSVVWEAEYYMSLNQRPKVRTQFGVDVEDFVVAVLGSNCDSRELWKEHAFVMRAVFRALARPCHIEKPVGCRTLRLFVIDKGKYGHSYGLALQAMADHLGFRNGSIHHAGIDSDLNSILWISDAVVYGALEEDKTFPDDLVRAMSLERPIIAPNFPIIKQYVLEGLLFTAGDDDSLCQSLLSLTKSKSEEIGAMVTYGRSMAKNLLATDAVIGYSRLLEVILDFSSQILLPLPTSRVLNSSKGWEWDVLTMYQGIPGVRSLVEVLPLEAPKLLSVELDLLKNLSRQQAVDKVLAPSRPWDTNFEDFEDNEWSHQRAAESKDEIERIEEEELEERREQSQAVFEDVNRSVKKAEREKDEIHERDDAELERTGQPLCIYESYKGSGAWPFLHQGNPLYRGLSLSTHWRRPKFDDVDAPSRLPLLNETYYQDILCEFGGFLAIAYRLDRVHKNAWIGFQPWYAAGRKIALSDKAEHTLTEVVTNGQHGDAVYFWAPLGRDLGSKHNRLLKPPVDFWAICDSFNAGNCRSIFLEAFQQMYGLPTSWNEIPPMPSDGGFWSGLHCWVMPTSSYMEFIMFSRLFLNALDAQQYEEHHERRICSLAFSKLEVRHCYCQLLETLVNVWAYHSSRRMIYVDPGTGLMEEQHVLKARRGSIWLKWFSFSTLKAIDEDLAEWADEERPEQRWLWPHTGEVFWHGMLERERQERYAWKIEKKRRNRERLARMRGRYKQKSLGRYVKPPPGAGYISQETEDISEPKQSLETAKQ